MTIYKTKRYGWRRDHLDPRDPMLTVAKRVSLPTACDLGTSGFLPLVYDQGQLGSCTANATAAVVDFERKKQAEQFLTLHGCSSITTSASSKTKSIRTRARSFATE
jgi:hypothetical protein